LESVDDFSEIIYERSSMARYIEVNHTLCCQTLVAIHLANGRIHHSQGYRPLEILRLHIAFGEEDSMLRTHRRYVTIGDL